MIMIDGSQGEGGGQILRSALALSILTGKPFRIINIRAQRPKPGLAAQHLACVRAAAAISHAEYKGGRIGSTSLYFEPATVVSQNYEFSIGTAGATSLVLQTIFLPLALRSRETVHLKIHGGTHVPHAPTADFLHHTWCRHLARMGVKVTVSLLRHGFYPRGGGCLEAVIEPCASLISLEDIRPLELTTMAGWVGLAELPLSVGERIRRRALTRLKDAGLESHLEIQSWENGPACVLTLLATQPKGPVIFSSIGERGVPAERVADRALDEAITYKSRGAPIDEHSADQILLPLVFADRPSSFLTTTMSSHLETNIQTIQKFIDRPITSRLLENNSCLIEIL